MDKPKREAILDLSKYTNERIRVKFTGGREGQSSMSVFIVHMLSCAKLSSHWRLEGI
jgi:hypothetical protein